MTVALVAEQAGRIIPQFCLIVDVRNTLVDTAVLALSESGFSDPWWHPGRWPIYLSLVFFLLGLVLFTCEGIEDVVDGEGDGVPGGCSPIIDIGGDDNEGDGTSTDLLYLATPPARLDLAHLSIRSCSSSSLCIRRTCFLKLCRRGHIFPRSRQCSEAHLYAILFRLLPWEGVGGLVICCSPYIRC
jgi:hypothetical protein